MIFFNPISRVYSFYKEKVLETTFYTLDVLLKVCVVFSILATFFAASVFLYIAFYNAHVPSAMHNYPVYLQYEPCFLGDKESSCPFPRSHIPLTKDASLLMVGQSYKLSVQLEMPESLVNRRLGVFMVCGQLVAKNGVNVAHSCRPSSLRYRSNLVHLMRTVVLAPFYIWGTLEEKQVLTVELFNDYLDDQAYPVSDLFLEVKSHNIEVYSSSLQINAHMSGLRYFMFYWRSSSAIIGVSFIFTFLTFIVTISLWQLYGPHNEAGREYIYEGINRITPFSFSPGIKESTLKEESDTEEIGSSVQDVEEKTQYISRVTELESSSEA